MSTTTRTTTTVTAGLVLSAGVLVIATASILIRYAQNAEVPSLSIAAIRLGVSALVLSMIVALRYAQWPQGVTMRHGWLAVLSGVCLAAHFASWITSLQYTSVASSAALVATTPLWVGIVARVWFKEALNRYRVIGMVLTIAGSIGIAVSDQTASVGTNPLLGNVLAIVGAISGSAYFLLGRGLRSDLPLLHYIWMTYGAAALVLLVAAIGFGFTTLPASGMTWLVLIGLALGPQLLGHTSINYAMRHLSALLVTIALLGEPVGSAILAFVLFQEQVAPLQVMGLIALLLGIGVTAVGERTQ
ncbi:MAG: DMT family transporter [Chloroflexi bacterium]|nr:MAG: DMT family transporter [Chloroflexota bacterium]RLT34065.1 MAG: DMT family transporter [Chloroflexota bacterium]